MELLDIYKDIPCATLSIPYWKSKYVEIPLLVDVINHSYTALV